MPPTLHNLCPGVHAHVHPHRLLGLFPLGHRMTVLELGDGSVAVHSPTPYTDALRAEIESLGRIACVLAPSTMHNLWLDEWSAKLGHDVRFLTVPGFAEKYPKLRTDGVLATGTEIAGLRCRTIDGMPKVEECAVLHESSRSLVVADLVFHFPHTDSFALRMLLKLVGAYGGVRASKLFRSFVKDRTAMLRSLDEILSWDFDRVIVGHGEIVEQRPKDQLREAWTR